MDYRQAWSYLDQLQFFKIKLGLDAMNRFLSRLGNPHARLSAIHIGGTNGKGSVGALLLSILSAAGYRVGFYTSPHLSSVRERFRINDTYISRQEFALLATEIRSVLGKSQITYFEFTTTLALLWFARQQVDLAILEVGMGGRLDATNVIRPLVSVITNISMDHEQYLGDTIEKIAYEKAGIIKAEIPLISGVDVPTAQSVISRQCQKLGSPCFQLGRDFFGRAVPGESALWQYQGLDGQTITDLPLNLKGKHQVGNAALALAVTELLGKLHCSGISAVHIRRGLGRAFWPGRLEHRVLPHPSSPERPVQYLLDGAHNPAGVLALREALINDFSFQRLILVWAAMADKDLDAGLALMAPLADLIIFTRPESERSATGEELRARLPATISSEKVLIRETVPEALQEAADRAGPEDLVCIGGSLYLVGAARQHLLGGLVNND